MMTSITPIEEGFLHLSLDASSNLRDLEQEIRQSGSRCEEVRVPVGDRFLVGDANAPPWTPDSVFAPQTLHLCLQLLQTLLEVQPGIEKITFDSGFTNNSNAFPFTAIGTVLTQAKALKRLER